MSHRKGAKVDTHSEVLQCSVRTESWSSIYARVCGLRWMDLEEGGDPGNLSVHKWTKCKYQKATCGNLDKSD